MCLIIQLIIYKIQMQESGRSITNCSESNYLFLVGQNKRLKEEIQDLKELVSINKVQIDILSKTQVQNKIANTPHDKKLIDLVYNYRNAYDQVRRKVGELRNLLQNKSEENLVLEQVNDQSIVQYKAAEEIYQKSIKQLQLNISELEQKMILQEKDKRQYDGVTGFVTKNRDIMQPSQVALLFKNGEMENNFQIQMVREKLAQAKKKQENLILTNTVLRNKVVTLQAKLAMPNKNVGQILDKSLKRLMVYFIQTQKKIITGEQSDSDDEDDLELIAPQIHGIFPEREIKKNNRNNIKIPQIDLKKVRQSIVNGNAKIEEQIRKRNHLSDKEKVQKLQNQLQFTRRELSKNIIQCREQIDKRKRCERILEELSNRNQILIQSNQNLSIKLQKCVKEIQRNKQKLIQYIENQTRYMQNGYGNSSNHYINPNIMNQLSFIHKDFHPDATLAYQRNNQPIQGANYNPIKLSNDSKIQFKIYMQILKKDLQNNKQLQKLKFKNLKQTKVRESGLKRSTSNPFLYFNERRQNIFDGDETKDKKAMEEGFRLEQTQYHVPQLNFRRQEDLDDIEI